jgi:hypothetical protein
MIQAVPQADGYVCSARHRFKTADFANDFRRQFLLCVPGISF